MKVLFLLDEYIFIYFIFIYIFYIFDYPFSINFPLSKFVSSRDIFGRLSGKRISGLYPDIRAGSGCVSNIQTQRGPCYKKELQFPQ